LRRDVYIWRESAIIEGLFSWSTVAWRVVVTGLTLGVRGTVVHDFLEFSLFPSVEEVSVEMPE